MKSKRLLPLAFIFSVGFFNLTGLAQTVIYDDSDGPFALLVGQTMAVVFPNVGEGYKVKI